MFRGIIENIICDSVVDDKFKTTKKSINKNVCEDDLNFSTTGHRRYVSEMERQPKISGKEF